MSNRPKVSIVIPTYNRADLLKEALESVVNQTESDWEALVIDNNSSDNTVETVAQFNDPRIQLHNIEERVVIATSRNLGIKLARADWVAFLDSDDLWATEKLEKCLLAVDDDTDLICHLEITFRGDKLLRVSSIISSSWPTYRNLLFSGNCFSTTALMARTEELKKANGFSEAPEFITVEDYELWMRLMGQGVRVKFVNESLSYYRLHGTNASSSVLRHRDAGMSVVNYHYNKISPRKPLDALRFRRRIAMLTYAAGRSFQAVGEKKQAFVHLIKSIILNPLQLKVYAAIMIIPFSRNKNLTKDV